MNKVLEIQLSEIHDIHWPVDERLVQSFQSTLQSGSDIPIILVNTFFTEDGWYYEVIDGLHRLAAKQREGATSILAQIVEVDERTARLQRIQACIGKPATTTIGRAKVELCRVFRDDILQQMGAITTVYEPVLTEAGNRSMRVRQEPLPDDPIGLLYVLGEHIRLLQEDAHKTYDGRAYPQHEFTFYFREGSLQSQTDVIPVEPAFVGWEQVIRNWVSSITSVFPGGRDAVEQIIKDEVQRTHKDIPNVTLLCYIPDSDIRRIVLRRYFSVREVSELADEFNWHDRYSQRPKIARSEQIRLLTTMPVGEVIYKLQSERKIREKAEREAEWEKERPEWEKQEAERERKREEKRKKRELEHPQESSSTVVFASAATKFLPTLPQRQEATALVQLVATASVLLQVRISIEEQQRLEKEASEAGIPFEVYVHQKLTI